MKNTLCILATLALALCSGFAQGTGNPKDDKPTDSKDTNTRFWEARLPGGHYMVALNRITSISKHTYLVGNIQIVEVVIDTDGNSLARFYAADAAGSGSDANILKNTIERGKEIMRDQGGRAGVSGVPVVKNYPNTTHAKTVEYNLENGSALNALYGSVKRAWERNKGTRFTQK